MRVESLVYLSSSRLPSKDANSVHVMKMCAALARCGPKVELWPRYIDHKIDNASLCKMYGVECNFGINRKRHRFMWAVDALLGAWTRRRMYVYGRDISYLFIFSLFTSVHLELHKPIYQLGWRARIALKSMLKTGRLEKIYVISSALEQLLRRELNGCDVDILVLHDGADPSPSKKIYRKNIRTISYVGHLYEGRGISRILELAGKFPHFNFELFGGTNQDLERWRSANVPNNVVFHGFVDPSEVPRILADSDILLAPYENIVTVKGIGNTVTFMSPLKIFEYMASGTPMVVSDLPAIREILNDQVSKFASASDLEDWVVAIEELRSPEVRCAIGSGARALLENSFTWDIRAQRVIDQLRCLRTHIAYEQSGGN